MSVVKNDNVVEIDYTLKNENGDVVDSSDGMEPLAFIMGKKNIIPGLESEIAGKSVGDSFNVTIAPEEAYGLRDEKMIQSVSKSEFGENADKVEVGHQFQIENQSGEPMIVRVVEVKDSEIVLDANHPMAGETLHFDVKIVSTREATQEELERGELVEDEGGCDPDGNCC